MRSESRAHTARAAKIDFTFERPAPPLPPHGWARKTLRRTTQIKFTAQQKEFLDMKFESGIKGGERIRDKKAWVEMKEHFKNQVDPVTGRPLVVKQSQIRAYFSRRAAKIKRDGIDAALASGRRRRGGRRE